MSICQGSFDFEYYYDIRRTKLPILDDRAQGVALALLDRRDDARKTVGRLLDEKPGFSRRFARRKLFCLKRPEQLRLYLDGLKKAGVPER